MQRVVFAFTLWSYVLIEEFLGFFQTVEFANIEDAEVWLDVAKDGLFCADFQVEVNDAELVGEVVEILEQTRIHVMNTCEGVLVIELGIEVGIRAPHFASRDVRPTHQTHVIIKEEITLRLPFAYQQGCRLAPSSFLEGRQVNIAQNVNIMDEKSVLCIAQKRCRMFDAATSLEQLLAFVAEKDSHTHWMLLAPLLYHVGKMVDVDNNICEACLPELLELVFEQRLAINGNQSLGYL